MTDLIDKYFPVLDYGFVSLKNHMGSDEDIERAARCSYGHGTRKTSDTVNLIRYLMRHKHTSPFEMCEFVFHIGLPIFVARQMVRHRTASLNEYSGRYSTMPLIYYTPDKEHLTKQSSSNKQGRANSPLYSDDSDYEKYVDKVNFHRTKTSDFYEDLLNADCAKELARIDLPLSTYTYWYWKIDLKNLFHFLKLRLDTHAQYEIRVYAEAIAKLVKQLVPISFQAFLDYDLYSKSLSFQEQTLVTLIRTANFRVSDSDIRIEGESLGMTKREIEDFLSYHYADFQEQASFELDISSYKEFSYFENLMQQHQVEHA